MYAYIKIMVENSINSFVPNSFHQILYLFDVIFF